MTLEFTWPSGTYLRLIFPIFDVAGNPLPVPEVEYPGGAVVEAAEWTLGHTLASSPLLRITPTRLTPTELLVEVPSGVHLDPGIYYHQLFLTLNDHRESVRSGMIRVLGGPPTDA